MHSLTPTLLISYRGNFVSSQYKIPQLNLQVSLKYELLRHFNHYETLFDPAGCPLDLLPPKESLGCLTLVRGCSRLPAASHIRDQLHPTLGTSSDSGFQDQQCHFSIIMTGSFQYPVMTIYYSKHPSMLINKLFRIVRSLAKVIHTCNITWRPLRHHDTSTNLYLLTSQSLAPYVSK